MFKIDNYEAPSETLRGRVIDIVTGEPVLTDQGSEGIRVRLEETSWEGNVTPQDFNCKPDGTFQNTKLFEADYNVRVDGPFIPIVREDPDGVPLYDGSQNVHIKGVTELEFKVQPFLKVEFVGLPTVDDGQITAKVKVTRAVSREDFKAAIEPMGNWKEEYLNVTDIQLLRNNIPVVKRSHHLPAAGNLNGIFLGFADPFQSIGDFISGSFAAFIRCLFAHSIVLDHRALFVPGSTVGHGVYKILSGQELSLRKFAAVIHPVPILGQQRFIIIPRHFLWGI